MEFWAGLTEAQATVISGVMTLLAAIVGVLLGSWLFSGRVRDLSSAIEMSDGLIRSHGSDVASALEQIRANLSEMQQTTSEQLNDLRASVADLEARTPQPETVAEGPDPEQAPEPSLQDQIRQSWLTVRDAIEHIAVRPSINGRTRAKYARRDRRRYGELVEELAEDGQLGGSAQAFAEASALWQRYRSGRTEPAARDVARMSELAAIASAEAARGS